MIAVRIKTPRPIQWIAEATLSAAEKAKDSSIAAAPAKAVAIVFVAAIFFVGYVTLPTTFVNLGNYLKDAAIDFTKARDTINTSYNGMLTFTGNPIRHKGAYINVNGFMARIMGQRVMNERVVLDNGNLEGMTGAVSADARKKIVNSALQIYNAQKERGKHYLFIIAPHKVDKYNPGLPAGVTTSYNTNWDQIAKELTAEGIPVLDLRELVHNEGLDYASLHYKTDHHWKAEAGFWAYQKIIEYFTANGAIPAVDSLYTDDSNFNFKVYKDRFLGSDGKRVGTTYVGVDDFTVIYPKFDTNMSVKITSSKIDKAGSFYDVALNHGANVLNYFNNSPYGIYGYGDKDYIQYRNENAPIDLKIVSYGDSYGNATFTFLPLVFKTCDEYDFRHFKGNFAQNYKDYNPDIVIGLFSGIGDNTTYTFFPAK
ncbi:MAG: hypothetical protein LBS11_10955 [Oscillospiraceae bacterium]|jgi:hypothetical protein|nr:hypothetical protein [Oscillospiraceae bacterium]